MKGKIVDPIILFRQSLAEEGELQAIQKCFPSCFYRSSIPKGSLVIPRYSALPYYKELEMDVNALGSSLINSYEEHNWVANFYYYEVLKNFTFETWDDTNFYRAPEGAYVVNGRTNSRKQNCNKQMFAASKREAINIAAELAGDSLIGPQGIIYRKYVPLKTYGYGFNGLPFTNEWRFFFLGKRMLSCGYYWSNSETRPAKCPHECIAFAHEVADATHEFIPFYVLDIAEKAEGGWILVEINDASMSGLSDNNPHELYSNLRKRVCQEYFIRPMI